MELKIMSDKLKWALISVPSSIIVLCLVLSFWWGLMPSTVISKESQNKTKIAGYKTTTAMIDVTSWLLDKPGGFLSNDILPPGLIMDNMPAFELGALEQVRDLSLAMRLEFSRSQSQSSDDKDLVEAQQKLNISHTNWAFPSSEKQYALAITALERYRARLIDTDQRDGQFYTRADNLADWLKKVEKNLGSVSQKLSASVGQERLNTDLAGDPNAKQSTYTPKELLVKTSWFKIDDVFYESKGSCWAILHFLKAAEVDFEQVLRKKNALVSLRQIIRDLEATQHTIWSPMVLNGDGFGVLANHSLVMANYVSRANAALIDLRALLEQG